MAWQYHYRCRSTAALAEQLTAGSFRPFKPTKSQFRRFFVHATMLIFSYERDTFHYLRTTIQFGLSRIESFDPILSFLYGT